MNYIKTIFLSLLIVLIASCNEDDKDVASSSSTSVNSSTSTTESVDMPEEVVVPFRVGLNSELDTSFVVDDLFGLILYNGPEFQLESSFLIGNELIEIDTLDPHLVVGKKYTVGFNEYTLQAYRTELPIIYINTDGKVIEDEPKIAASMTLLESGEENFESLIGIEVRGGSSKRFPKQSFSMELWEDDLGEDTHKKELLGLRDDDDWILDGLWNEPLRIRDDVSHALWLKIGRYPYEEDEPNITFGIENKFVELFINDEYRGVYYLGERIDRKQLDIKKYDDEDGLRGELYKGNRLQPGALFTDLQPYSNAQEEWSGFEAEYPDEIGEIDWTNLHNFVDFVVNSTQETFDLGIAQRVHIENMADYYILLNMIYARDNIARNTYFGRYDSDEPYFYLPWDMDGSFGNNWRGVRTNITDELLSNGLFDRLLDNDAFTIEVKNRWNTLKENELSVTSLQNMFTERYNFLNSNGVYERETVNPELPQNYSEEEILFIHTWIAARFAFLDTYFSEL